MRLDHVAYRVADRHKTAKFFIEAFGYSVQKEFSIDFGEGHTAQCIALTLPVPQKTPWSIYSENTEYHLPPEIFVSDGNLGSIVGDWVASRGGIGGIHHIAYQVENVAAKMQEWKEKGYAEFTSENPMHCPGLTQVFTKPSLLTGIIYEFIERGEFGFCQDNVKQLMESTKGI